MSAARSAICSWSHQRSIGATLVMSICVAPEIDLYRSARNNCALQKNAKM